MAGLVGEVVVAVVLVYSTPLAVAVIATNVLTPTVLLTPIALTQLRATRSLHQPQPGDGNQDATVRGSTDAAESFDGR